MIFCNIQRILSLKITENFLQDSKHIFFVNPRKFGKFQRNHSFKVKENISNFYHMKIFLKSKIIFCEFQRKFSLKFKKVLLKNQRKFPWKIKIYFLWKSKKVFSKIKRNFLSVLRELSLNLKRKSFKYFILKVKENYIRISKKTMKIKEFFLLLS